MASSTSNSEVLRYLSGLILSVTLCFCVQGLALKQVGGRPGKSESNFFSSLGRIQAGIRMEPRVMLLGSSITGRLPDESGGFDGVANLGCDGGSAADVLRAIDRGTLPGAPLLIVEGNTLYRAVGASASEVGEAIDGLWFSVGRRIPVLSAAARPSAFAYSALLERRLGQPSTTRNAVLPVKGTPGVPVVYAPLGREAEALVAELSEVISRLQNRGMRVEVVVLPPGAAPGSPNLQVPQVLAGRSGVRFWDLNKGLPEGAVKLTDGVHMDRASATATLRTLMRQLTHDAGGQEP